MTTANGGPATTRVSGTGGHTSVIQISLNDVKQLVECNVRGVVILNCLACIVHYQLTEPDISCGGQDEHQHRGLDHDTCLENLCVRRVLGKVQATRCTAHVDANVYM